MFENYFKTAVRNLFKHKVFSIINVFGLALGIAACLLILQYVWFEWSYDNFHEKGNRIFRVQQNRYNEGKLSTQWAAGAAGIGPAVKDHIPEVESFAKLAPECYRGEATGFAMDNKNSSLTLYCGVT